MVINGRVRQACSALVENLLADVPDEIELQPMHKFPVIRDLCVNRRRLFRALEKLQTWIPVDSYIDMGPGPRQSAAAQETAYPLSQCMSCGCCLDACPQFARLEPMRAEGQSDADFAARKRAVRRALRRRAAISQTVFYNSHPTGGLNAGERLAALTEPGGIQVAATLKIASRYAPKEIPLTTSIGLRGRAATKRGIHPLVRRLDCAVAMRGAAQRQRAAILPTASLSSSRARVRGSTNRRWRRHMCRAAGSWWRGRRCNPRYCAF